ncbi:DNA internalization-related competence protein ComEC/Rec2 [Streptococcus dentiloxodontae]
MWIDKLAIKPIELALLVMALYGLVFALSSFTVSLAVICFLCFLRSFWKNGRALRQVGFICLFFLTSFFFLAFRAGHLDQSEPDSLNQVTVISDSISVNGDSLSFRGKSGGRLYQLYYSLKTEKEKSYFQRLTRNSLLVGKISLSEPAKQRNFQGFNYKSYLKAQGIYRIGKIKTINNLSPIKNLSFFDGLRQLRRQAIVHIQTHFPNPMRHYMTGLLFGYLDKEFDQISDLYTSLGIIHLFALSGMQVGFFLGIFRKTFLRLGLPLDYLLYLQIPFSIGYAFLTGFTASVLRSLLQAVLAELGFKKLDNIGLTLLFMFFILPHYLLTIGGVLSFTYAFILAILDFDKLPSIKQASFTSLALSLGVLPILIYSYGTFQPVSLLLTAIFSVIFDVLLLPILSLLFLVSFFIIIDVINPFFIYMESVLAAVSRFLGGPLVFGKPSHLQLAFLLLVLFALYDFWKRVKLRNCLFLLLAVLLLWVKFPLVNEITMVDVGQGDSIFIRDMKGETVLIDVGGKVSFAQEDEWQKGSETANAENTLLPYLQARGISSIDHLVLTHTDTDHIGDLEVVAKTVAVKEICVSQGSLTNGDFVNRLKALKLPVRVLTAGDSIEIMGSRLQVLYPLTAGDGGNNDSVVLFGNFLNKRFLFTGDLEAEGEEALIAAYPNLRTDVLKAGHHGSKGSSSEVFLDHLSASTALISAGINNRYKHPNDETLERFEKRQLIIYRTDKQGAIRYSGIRSWSVQTVH